MTDTSDWFKSFKPFLERVMKLKVKMLEKNLSQAKATCVPPCSGFIHATIAPSNNHIWAGCKKCGRSLIE